MSTQHSCPQLPNFQGAKPIPLLVSISIGVIVRFAIPKPDQVTPQAWQLFAIFLSTIAGLILSPLPNGAWAFIALTVTVVTKTLPFAIAFAAFTNEWLGKSTLGLSYGLTISEVLIAPAMPSTTARAGGVFMPIIKSLSISVESRPNEPSKKKIGSFLVLSQFQTGCNSSALFLTGAAQNMLCIKLAEELGVKIKSPWVSWFKAASLPAIVCLLVSPFVIYKISPPETKSTPDAPAMATDKLRQMGPIKMNEWMLIVTVLLAIALWISGWLFGPP